MTRLPVASLHRCSLVWAASGYGKPNRTAGSTKDERRRHHQHKRVLRVILALTWVTGAAAQAPSTQPAPTPAGNAEEGKKLYDSYGCYQCHGREAQGSSATGPRLGPRPIAFTAFSQYVRRPTGQMPPYTAKVVSDADMTNIYAFVQTRPTPPAVQSIPLLREK
jgi:mono/diheme cytochrome c family protein